MKTGFNMVTGLVCALVGTAVAAQPCLADNNAWQTVGERTSFVSVSGTTLTLITTKLKGAVKTTVLPATVLGGICGDCGQFLPFVPSKSASICTICSCGSPNATCVSWTTLKTPFWQAMLQSLPLGVGIRAVFNTANDPSSGLKNLYINRHEVLLPVTGLANLTSPQLLKLVQPIGATSATLVDDGTRLKLNVKGDWSAAASKKLIDIIEKVGGKLAEPAPVTADTK